MSEFSTQFRKAFASRAGYSDGTYCKQNAAQMDIKPEFCDDLVPMAQNGYISVEEIADICNRWADGADKLEEIRGDDGAALLWARIDYLKDQVVKKWWRWDASDEARIQMIQELSQYHLSTIFPTLVQVLKERDLLHPLEGPVQDAAREALAQLAAAPDRHASWKIIDAFRQEEDKTKQNEALAKLKDKIHLDAQAATDVVAALTDPDPSLRWHAAQILGRMGTGAKDAGFMTLAKVAAQDPYKAVRDTAIVSMRRMIIGDDFLVVGEQPALTVPDEAAQWLVKAMAIDSYHPWWKGRDSSEVDLLLRGCSAKAIEAEIPNLVAIFSNPSQPDFRRYAAACVLARSDLRHPLAVPALLEYLKEDKSTCSCNALSRWGDREAVAATIPEIEKIVFNQKLADEPRFWALSVLEFVDAVQKNNQSLPIILRALEEPTLNVSKMAVYLLGQRLQRNYLPREDFLAARRPLEALLQNSALDTDFRNHISELLTQLPLQRSLKKMKKMKK